MQERARAPADQALRRGRAPARSGAAPLGAAAILALQRAAGNEAINALMLGQLRMPGPQAAREMAEARTELHRDEPVVDKVEKGLKAARALGIPVDLDGIKPPASALAVTSSGFGPGAVAAKKPVPPPKKTPPVSPLGKAAAKKAPPPQAAGPARAPSLPAQGVELAPQPTVDPYQPPAKPTLVRPDDDPAFVAVTGRVKTTAKQARAHAPASAKAKEAQDAAIPPTNDIGSQAKAAKADTMDAQRPGSFDKKAFIAAVEAAIAAKTPKTLAQADKYKESGKTAEVKGEIKGMVAEGKAGQSRDIAEATAAPPDQSKAIAKPVTPMGPEPVGAPATVPAAGAVPKPAPADQLNLAAGTHQANDELAEADVSEKQLAESNEPQFTDALADKRAAAAQAEAAPAAYRAEEARVIGQGKAEAQADTASGLSGMQSFRAGALAKLVADKGKAKTKDEAKRAEVTTRIDGIFNATETDVKKILDGIDPKVDKEFNAGEAAARATFESYVSAKMSAYKKDRYGGWLGKLRWVRDKIKGMPAKVNEFYEAGRELYLKEMNRTISRVADIVGTDLTAAKTRIAKGRADIASYVKSLPKDLQKVGADASKEIGERFEQLESDVDSKQETLVDELATKYVEARKGLDERIEELQAENKGLVDKAIGAIKAVINTIRELVAMLKDVLSRAAGVVGQIIKAPVKFLGNLIAGVKGGILKFKDDFLGHLRRGLMSWLFGALAEGGIELPKSFDIKGIIGFLASIFGLTWANIRNRLVKQIGEKAMGAVEKGVEIFKVISGPDGIGGLWQMLMEKLGDIKEMIFTSVKDFVQDRIISAGITWLIGLLNPAGAFIKACKLIYDIVMFFVNNASRLAKFVNTILDSMAEIVRGNISAVVNKVNDVLGQMVPIIIGFLASLIGLGGIGAKVKEIITKLQKPVNKAIDFVIKTGLKLAGPIIRGIAGIGKKVKAKVAAGKAWVKGKAEAGKKWVKAKAQTIGEKLGIIRRPVRLQEKERTLSADLKSGAVVLRSVAATAPDQQSRVAISAEEEQIRHLTRTGPAARAPVANHLRQIGDMLVEAHRRVGPTAVTPGGVPANGALTQQQQRVQAALADPVRKHSTNSARGTQVAHRGQTPPELHLESEHVIPVSWVSIALRVLGRAAIDRKGGFLDKADDKSMSTVLMYRQASNVKTGEEGPIFDDLSAIVDQTLPARLREGSSARAAQQLRGSTTRAQRDQLRSDWQAGLGQAKARLLENLDERLGESVARTERVVVADHTPAKQAVRGHQAPLPQPGHIRAAATQQIQQMARILSERVEDMYPAESAFSEAAHEENVREDLRKAGGSSGGAPPPGYKRLASGLFVPNEPEDR